MKKFLALAFCTISAIAHPFHPPPPPPGFSLYQAEASGLIDSSDLTKIDFRKHSFSTYVPAVHHFTEIYNYSIRKRSVCIESGFYGTIEGYKSKIHKAVHPCLHGRISASEDGKKLVIESPRGTSNGPSAYASVISLGPVTLLQHTLEIKVDVDAYTPYESISICGAGKLCAINGVLNESVLVTPIKDELVGDLSFSNTKDVSITPELGTVYVIRVTNESVVSDDLRKGTMAIVKLVVAAVDDGRISFEWGILYGDSRFKRNITALLDVVERFRDRNHNRRGGEKSSTRGAAITGLIFSLFCIVGIVILFYIQFKDKIGGGYSRYGGNSNDNSGYGDI